MGMPLTPVLRKAEAAALFSLHRVPDQPELEIITPPQKGVGRNGGRQGRPPFKKSLGTQKRGSAKANSDRVQHTGPMLCPRRRIYTAYFQLKPSTLKWAARTPKQSLDTYNTQ